MDCDLAVFVLDFDGVVVVGAEVFVGVEADSFFWRKGGLENSKKKRRVSFKNKNYFFYT